MKILSDIEKVSIIADYSNGMTLECLSVKYKSRRKTLWQFIRRRGLKIRETQGCRKHYCDESYFSKIDNSEKAYWLGFIYADGNVYKNTFSINLARKDKSHLIKLASCLKFTGQIEDGFYTRKKKKVLFSRIRINSRNICRFLKSQGVHPKKSFTIEFPLISDEFIADFIRGFLDGDGWITRKIRPKNRYEWTIGFVSGSKRFLDELLERVQLICEIKTGKVYKRKNKDVWQITFDGNTVSNTICSHLYYMNSIGLDRKQNMAMKCKNS